MGPNMAATVLSGGSNPTYTNKTGQNVRLVILFMKSPTSVSWAGVTATTATNVNLPAEIMLAPNQTFSAVCGAYNLLALTEYDDPTGN